MKFAEIKDKKVGYSPNDLYELTKDNNNLYKQCVNEFVAQERKYLDGLLEFSYRVIQTVGLLAGFGFTGVSRVQDMTWFIFGELLCVVAILAGVFIVRGTYKSTIDTINRTKHIALKPIWSKTEYLLKTSENYPTNGMPDDFASQLQKLNHEILTVFAPEHDERKDEKIQDSSIWVIGIGAVGIVLILFSFTGIC